MTGNVVFLGFALAGAPGFSIVASVVALASFWSGAFIGGRVGSDSGNTRIGCSALLEPIQGGFLAVSVVLGRDHRRRDERGIPLPLIVVLGLAMGSERNGAQARSAGPDHDRAHFDHYRHCCRQRARRRQGIGLRRRLIAVAAMLIGGLLGAALVIHVRIVFPW